MMRPLSTTVWLALAACASTKGAEARRGQNLVRVADCAGPALSLPDRIADTLTMCDPYAARDAALASTVPGGYAGVLYDSAHRPVLLLTRPQAADSAKAALATPLAESHFPIMRAAVHAARWDDLQLATWYSYVYPQIIGIKGLTGGYIDVIHNRISISVIDVHVRDRLIRKLVNLRLPCDLVMVTISGPNQLY